MRKINIASIDTVRDIGDFYRYLPGASLTDVRFTEISHIQDEVDAIAEKLEKERQKLRHARNVLAKAVGEKWTAKQINDAKRAYRDEVNG